MNEETNTAATGMGANTLVSEAAFEAWFDRAHPETNALHRAGNMAASGNKVAAREGWKAALAAQPAPVVPERHIAVPVALPALAVSAIKDMLEEDYQLHDTKARPLWAKLLEIVTGLTFDQQVAINEEATKAPAQPAPVVGGPVGFANVHEFNGKNDGFMCCKKGPLTESSFFTVPLYTHPMPPVAAEPKVWPSPDFEEWFAGVEAGDGTIPVPQSIADGDAWHEHIGRRQIALGAWEAALLSARPGGEGVEVTIEMARAFKVAHDEHAASRIPKIYAAGQREEANIIVGLRAARARDGVED